MTGGLRIFENSDTRSVAASLLVSIVLLLGFLNTLSLVEIRVNPTLRGITYFLYPSNTELFAQPLIGSIVIAIALTASSLITCTRRIPAIVFASGASFIIVIAALGYLPVQISILNLTFVASFLGPYAFQQIFKRTPIYLHVARRDLICSIFAIIIAFEIAVILMWIGQVGVKSEGPVRPVTVEYNIFYILSYTSPFLFLICIFSFLVKLLVDPLLERMKWLSIRISDLYSVRSHESIVLIISLLLPSLFVFLLYLPTLNPHDRVVGVDLSFYKARIDEINQNGLSVTLENWFIKKTLTETSLGPIPSDRVLAVLLLYITHWVYPDQPIQVIKYTPAFFQTFLCVSVYVFVKTGLTRKDYASYSALLATLSPFFVVGLYSGFIAAWLAISLSFLFFAAVLKAMESGQKRYYSALAALSVAILFSHSATWVISTMVAIVFLAIQSARSFMKHSVPMSSLLTLGSIGAVILGDYIRTVILGRYQGLQLYESGIEVGGFISQQFLNFQNFIIRYGNLNYLFNLQVGGFFSMWLIYLLAATWLVALRYKNISNFRLLLALMFFVPGITFLFTEFNAQTHILFYMPFYIPAALVLLDLRRLDISNSVRLLLFITILVIFASYAVRSLYNLALVA